MGYSSANKNYIAVATFGAIMLIILWHLLQNYSERTSTYDLSTDINEIQWQASQIREKMIGIRDMILIASHFNSYEYNDEIETQSNFLIAHVKALLSQPFLTSLTGTKEIRQLENLQTLFETDIINKIIEKAPDYTLMLNSINHIKPEIWRMTILTSTASLVRSRAIEQAKNSTITNFTYAFIITALGSFVLCLFFMSRTRAQYNQQVRQFALLFSHMTFTRINGLNLWVHDILSPTELPDLSMLIKARKRVEYLTQMTQWLSRIAYPKQDTENTPYVPLIKIINEIAAAPDLPKIDIIIMPPSGDVAVPQAQIHLILQELICNAQDALTSTHNPNISIQTAIYNHWFSAKRIEILITDNGCGMNTDEISLALTPFYSSKGETYGHSGLGLTGCLRLIEAMGGKLSIISKPGKGTTVSFTYPIPNH